MKSAAIYIAIAISLSGCSLLSTRPKQVTPLQLPPAVQSAQPERYEIPREAQPTMPDNAPYYQDGRFGTKPYPPGEGPYRIYPPGYIRYPEQNPPL